MMILHSKRLTAGRSLVGVVPTQVCCMRYAVLACFVSLITLGPVRCEAQDRRSPIIEKRVERVLREYAHKSGASGLAFGIVQNGSTLLECYTGYASWADDRSIDASSVFDWASLSKGLTAVCALKMAEQGQLNLDADIKEYIPELDLQAAVPLRKLLDQQGGIGGYPVYPELFELKKLGHDQLTQQAILAKMTGKQAVFEPGTHQGYSSPAYILLSIAMERAAKKSFADIVDEIIAKPLQLSSLRVGKTSEADVVPYRLINGKREKIEEGNNDWRLGAGAIKSNLKDALAFASALLQSSILTPESSKELFKRRATVRREGNEEEMVGITYGFMRIGEGIDSSIAATGMQPGSRALLVIYPGPQMASVIFANTTPLDLEQIQVKAMESVVKR